MLSCPAESDKSYICALHAQRNEANLDDMKLMITDDVTMIARGNEISGESGMKVVCYLV